MSAAASKASKSKKVDAVAAMSPELYHNENAKATKSAMWDEARKAEKVAREDALAKTLAVIDAALRKAGFNPGKAKPRTDRDDRDSRVFDAGVVTITASIRGWKDKPETDMKRAHALQSRTERFKDSLTAGAQFARFCRVRTGIKSDPIPVADLDALWLKWIDYTCGTRP